MTINYEKPMPGDGEKPFAHPAEVFLANALLIADELKKDEARKLMGKQLEFVIRKAWDETPEIMDDGTLGTRLAYIENHTCGDCLDQYIRAELNEIREMLERVKNVSSSS